MIITNIITIIYIWRIIMWAYPVIGPDAIMLTGGRGLPVGAAQVATPTDNVIAKAAAVAAAGTGGLVGRTVAAVERDLIIDTLSHCLGNRTHAANILGISIRTLRNKLKQYSEEGVAVPAAHGESEQASY